MSREVRKVPESWEHPKRDHGSYVPLYDGYQQELKDFSELIEEKGLAEALDYCGGGPCSDDYMPDWPESERTHFQMYETCSEGTPISPVCETPEELARWLADNNASAFGDMTATYEQWVATIDAGHSMSAVSVNGRLMSGVEFMGDKDA